jgi:hypothetical protein
MIEMSEQTLADIRAIRAEAAAREKAPGYKMGSVRSIAHDLSIPDDRLEAVLMACVDGGFSYCLDETIATKDRDGKWSKPSWRVCYWGPDQLRSRLDCVDYRVYAETV